MILTSFKRNAHTHDNDIRMQKGGDMSWNYSWPYDTNPITLTRKSAALCPFDFLMYFKNVLHLLTKQKNYK